jgi:outer membrane receptor protein involved in Fe transport
MKKRTVLSVLALLFFFTTAFTFEKQSGKVTGKVLDNQHNPISFANILLFSNADSSLTKVEYSKEDGSFELLNVPAGEYWLSVTFVGFEDYASELFTISADQVVNVPAITLKSSSVELDAITIVGRKPLVEVHADKTVFNVENSINATGNDAMELLRKAPGVVVDNNDNIIMNGKNGVKVYIDGKPTHLSNTDLAAYLRTIQSTDISNLEIITNPSSKYDAEGNAGIINIRMKKDRRFGANATVNLGYTKGDFNNYNGSFSGNYRSKALNTFGSYNLSDGKSSNWFDLYREQLGIKLDQKNEMLDEHQSHNFKLGTDLFFNEKHTLGILINGYHSDHANSSSGKMLIGSVGSNTPDSSLIANTDSDGTRSNYNWNINYRFDDGQGRIWNLDADYGFFRNKNNQIQPNQYRSGDGGAGSIILDQRDYITNAPTEIDIYTAKVDHERPFLKGQLGAGAKFSYVRTDNDFKFYNVKENIPVIDPDRTNHFIYLENVNAVYTNYSRQFGKFGFQAGIRIEQTNSEGDLTALKPTNNQNVKRNYIDFFPSGGITWQPNQKNMLQVTYSRRIDRPSYQDLNPFEGRLDELTFEKGNPFLNPQYTHSIQINHTLNYMYNTSLSFSRTTDLITRLTDIDLRDSSASFITWENLAEQNNLSLSFGAPITFSKWWNAYANISGYRTHNKADFGDGKVVDLTIYAYNFYAQNTFNLPAGIALEVSGWYNSPSVWGGTFEVDAMWSLDAGLQKKLFNDNATLKFSVSDIFKTNKWDSESIFGALFIKAIGGWDSRRIKVNFSYTIGNQQVKNARRRSTGLEEEKNRIKN